MVNEFHDLVVQSLFLTSVIPSESLGNHHICKAVTSFRKCFHCHCLNSLTHLLAFAWRVVLMCQCGLVLINESGSTQTRSSLFWTLVLCVSLCFELERAGLSSVWEPPETPKPRERELKDMKKVLDTLTVNIYCTQKTNHSYRWPNWRPKSIKMK